MTVKRIQSGLRKAINAMPGKNFSDRKKALAMGLGITVQSIHKWKAVPRKRIVDVERLSGVRREVMAPDLYR